jgi:Pectic acid lyase
VTTRVAAALSLVAALALRGGVALAADAAPASDVARVGAGAAHAEARALAGEDRIAVDAVAACARPGGGWSYVCQPSSGPHGVVTRILIRARQIGELLGLADWDVLVLRSPGTPAAGLVMLEAWRRTADEAYLATARRAGDLLVDAQLPSGGWASEMPVSGAHLLWWFRWLNQWTALDDDVTSGGARFLVALWETTGEARYRGAAERALDLLVDAQLPSGAWPLTWRPGWLVAMSPSFEDQASTNDGATAGPIESLLRGAAAFGRPEYLEAARRGGDWLLAAQGRAPNEAWAQQYAAAGTPSAGRSFEPPGYASWESREMVDALVALVRAGAGDIYCRAVPGAVAWFLRSAIAPGCWARLYALDDGSPLYVDREGRRVETPAGAKRPYKWTGDFGIPGLLGEVGLAADGTRLPPTAAMPPRRMFGDAGACPGGVGLADAPDRPNPRARIARATLRLERTDPSPQAVCTVESDPDSR